MALVLGTLGGVLSLTTVPAHAQVAPTPVADCSGDTAPSNTTEESDPSCGTLIDTWVPSAINSSGYDVGADEGGAFAFTRKWLAGYTAIFFTGTKWIVVVGWAVVHWALTSELLVRLVAPFQDVAQRWQTNVIDRLNLQPFFLALAAGWGGWLVMTGRMARGAGEFVVSCLLLAILTAFWSNPGTNIERLVQGAKALGTEVATAASGGNDTVSLTQAMHEVLIVIPQQWLDWGRVIPNGDRCRATYDELVRTGPWGMSDTPRDKMSAAGCKKEARWNHDPTGDRMVGSIATMVVALIVMVAFVLVALGVLKAQAKALVAILLAPFAFPCALLPGRGRSLFWRWCAFAAASLLEVVGMLALLGLLLPIARSLLTVAAGETFMVRELLLAIAAVSVILMRKRLQRGFDRAAASAVETLANARPGGGGHQKRVSISETVVAGAAGGAAAGSAFAAANRYVGTAQRFRAGHQRSQTLDVARQRNTSQQQVSTLLAEGNQRRQEHHDQMADFAAEAAAQREEANVWAREQHDRLDEILQVL